MEPLIEKVKHHCLKLLSYSTDKVLPYHNLQHTLDVYKNVIIIGKHENLTVDELEILQIAALFHDTGILEKFIGHEEVSVENAQFFLEKNNYPKRTTEQVVQCILATKMPQNPQSTLERVICDADLFHLASPRYYIKSELLRSEWEISLNIIYTDEEWQSLNFNFLKNHRYFTSYCQSELEEKKQKNCNLLQQAIP
jgi:predicted metal-dependent HD superfamily phosphohydrolase